MTATTSDRGEHIEQLYVEAATLSQRLADVNARLDDARRILRAAELPTTAQRQLVNALEAERLALSGMLEQTESDRRQAEQDRDAAALEARRQTLFGVVLHTKKTDAERRRTEVKRRTARRALLDIDLEHLTAHEHHNAALRAGRQATRQLAEMAGLVNPAEPVGSLAEDQAINAVLEGIGMRSTDLYAVHLSALPAVPVVRPEMNRDTVRAEFAHSLEVAQ